MITSLLLFFIIAALGGYFQAHKHLSIIKFGKMNAELKKRWVYYRLIYLGSIVVLLTTLGDPILPVMFLFIAAWMLYGTVFRRTLNDAAGWDVNYMGSTSRYDIFFISLSIFTSSFRWPSAEAIKASHDERHANSAGYREVVRRAGRMATHFEIGTGGLFAFLAALDWYVL